eukprot:gi/632940921/ref/XP_007885591.1/ PREDICTED: Hermansky-Pudlak syndrome 5 protein [Callorhinchus milii]
MSVPVLPESCSHVLTELDWLDPLLSAIRLDSNRLKCTCVSMSRKWLALGSSAGGLHLIQKEGWKQRLMLTHKEGALALVAFCQHDEDYVAVATSQGHVIVWELHLERRGKPERVYVSTEHRGRQVTALRWDTATLRVFVGDSLGKVSALKINSSKQGKAAAFVMFPVQMITTVDSRVVQLDYLEGKLLVSSLTRCYLCDTEREKFWKIGNKERDGEFGACFLPGMKGAGALQSLIFCARPGSRLWEVNCEGEVLSTHQFKQLLASPPVPIVTHRSEPHYKVSVCCPQSVAFPRLLCLSEHYVVSWTNRAVYVFVPQNVQVLLWSELRDVRDIAVYRNELLCLHADGRVTHLYLLSAERCVERLLRRELWILAAHVCCLYQHSVTGSRARKVLPIDRLEHLKLQLSNVSGQPLMSQLEEVLSRLEPPASACSSRRSSISSHESFNVLDSGIYRVISRRSSQSDEDSGSLHSHQSEEEPLREVTVQHEEEQAEQDTVSHSSLNTNSDRSETLIPFHLPLSFRSTSPRLSLQAVKESVSSFVRKTKETIGTLHASSELRFRADVKDGDLLCETVTAVATCSQDPEPEFIANSIAQEPDKLQELRLATGQAVAKLQDPLVLFETPHLKAALRAWLPHLEKNFRINIQTHPENLTHRPKQGPAQGHREEEGPAQGHREEEGPAQGHREEEGPAQGHREEEGPAQGHREEEGPAQGHREEEGPAQGHREEEGPAQGHREEEGPAQGHPEEEGPAQGHREEEGPAQGHREEEGPAQGHREEEGPAQGHPEEEGPAQGHPEEEGPAQGHPEEEGPAQGHPEEEGPAQGHPEEEGPAQGHPEEEGPAQGHREEEGTVLGHWEEPAQGKETSQGHREKQEETAVGEQEETARGHQEEEEAAQVHREEEAPTQKEQEEGKTSQGHQEEREETVGEKQEETARGEGKEEGKETAGGQREEPARGHRGEGKESAWGHLEGAEGPAWGHQREEEEEPAWGHQREEGPAQGHQREEEGPVLGHQREEEEGGPAWHRQREDEVPAPGPRREGEVWGGAAPLQSEALLSVPFMLYPQTSVPAELFKELVELSTLCFELGVFDTEREEPFTGPDRTLHACLFIRNYFFLLDLGRVKRYISTCYAHAPLVWHTFILALRELTQSDPITAALDTHNLHTFLKLLSGEQLLGSPFVLAHASRLYETFGEVGLRSLVQFYPSILPCDIMGLCWKVPAHFLGYMDSLVKSQPEEQRLSLLEETLQPQSLRVHWLQVAVSHDAPHTADIMDAAGNPRPHSHRFSWGFAQLIGHFIQLPADQDTKEKMADICKHSGFWPGFLALCAQLEWRLEAFTIIVHLDDISLLDGENGLMPETVEEWRVVLELAGSLHEAGHRPALHNGDVEPSGSLDPESVALLLAKTIGPERALAVLQDSGLAGRLSHRFTTVCDILSIAEKRQRALIQSMLERCDRFLWSQQA